VANFFLRAEIGKKLPRRVKYPFLFNIRVRKFLFNRTSRGYLLYKKRAWSDQSYRFNTGQLLPDRKTDIDRTVFDSDTARH